MTTQYVERDCTIEHGGRTFESGGAVVTDSHIVAYLAKDGILTNWHGQRIGTYRITSTWKTPRSWISSTMSQVEATVNGIKYTGRSAGIGMIFNGKPKAD